MERYDSGKQYLDSTVQDINVFLFNFIDINLPIPPLMCKIKRNVENTNVFLMIVEDKLKLPRICSAYEL